MTNERLSRSAPARTVIARIGSWLLIIPSIVLGILFVELTGRVFLPRSAQSVDMRTDGVAFFAGNDTIFRNQGDIFTYIPHSEIRNVTGVFSDTAFKIEYDYRFWTNNFGLVQDADIVPDRESLLLLGDSFTEGQGAEPWFRLVSPEIDKLGLQAINGGLMATGFEQWLQLERYLAASNIKIRKIVVLFISFDYIRPIFNLKPNDFRCLADLRLCRLEDSLFYRLPPPDELSSWVAKIRTARARAPIEKKPWLEARAEALLPKSYHFYQRFRMYLSTRTPNPVKQQSRDAIGRLISIYGAENVAFIHLPQKDEVERGRPISFGVQARRAIEEAGGKLFDGFQLCRLTVGDYHPNDAHPNRAGYTKIASCASNVIKELMAGAQ